MSNGEKRTSSTPSSQGWTLAELRRAARLDSPSKSDTSVSVSTDGGICSLTSTQFWSLSKEEQAKVRNQIFDRANTARQLDGKNRFGGSIESSASHVPDWLSRHGFKDASASEGKSGDKSDVEAGGVSNSSGIPQSDTSATLPFILDQEE